MDSDGKPRRPAPPLPSAAWSKQASYTSLRTSQSSTTIKCNHNGTGKETVIVVQRKSAKKVPSIMRKFKMDKKIITGSGSAMAGGGNNNNNNNNNNGGSALASAAAREAVVVRQRAASTTSTSAVNDNRSARSVTAATSLVKHSTRNGYQAIQSRPMIIRPGSNHHAKKKAPPPRPPPPKLTTQVQSRTASSTAAARPPSYDDVLRADLNAFMSESKGPRLKPKAPARPTSMSKQADLLIDFDAPPTVPRKHLSVERPSQPKSLLDLDITASASLLDTPAKQMPCRLPYALADPSQNPWNGGDVRRGGDDWLQSCLRDSANGVFGRHGDGFSEFNAASSPPPLPPRPRIAQAAAATSVPHAESFCDVETCPSPEPPTSAAPPVPPLPFTDALSTFQLESGGDAVPPLPPRPKLMDLSRPCAVALYDYVTAESGDLSFRAGDAITLVHEVNDEWLYGVIDDREGLFPKNFVDVVVPLTGSRDFEDVNDGPRCRAIYDFYGTNDGELSFSADDVISLVERVNDDWFRGKLHGSEGLFPVTFVEVLKDLKSVAESDVSEQWTKMTKTAAKDRPLVVGARCVAIYDFAGEPGELTLWEGERLEVTGVVNDDWLVGRKLELHDDDDSQGRFPKNFVELL